MLPCDLKKIASDSDCPGAQPWDRKLLGLVQVGPDQLGFENDHTLVGAIVTQTRGDAASPTHNLTQGAQAGAMLGWTNLPAMATTGRPVHRGGCSCREEVVQMLGTWTQHLHRVLVRPKHSPGMQPGAAALKRNEEGAEGRKKREGEGAWADQGAVSLGHPAAVNPGLNLSHSQQ